MVEYFGGKHMKFRYIPTGQWIIFPDNSGKWILSDSPESGDENIYEYINEIICDLGCSIDDIEIIEDNKKSKMDLTDMSLTEKNIIKIVNECFKNNIGIITVGRGNFISGEEEFYNNLEIRLKELFNENDLSK
jgi:hypothetical protein